MLSMNGGETDSTGVIEAKSCIPSFHWLVKPVSLNIIANDYEYAVAA